MKMRHAILLAGFVTAFVGPAFPAAQAPAGSTRVLFEGARLIAGDGSQPIDGAALFIEGGRIVQVGRRDGFQLPAGATRVDLAGKTIIPALIDTHSHIGYMRDLTSGAQNYTRENILDHLSRFAYFGVAASQAMGSDFGELPYQIRDETAAGKIPGVARFLTAGRGLAPLDEISPTNMRQAAYAVTTPEGARASVQELAARKVPIVKTWVDDRNGTVKKLTPDLYRAIIDEAHVRGLKVAVHATELEDAKPLLRAGVDIFAHMISEVDDELVTLFKAHPNTVVLSALGGQRRATYAPWLHPVHPLITETISPAQIARLQARFPLKDPKALKQAADGWDQLSRGLARLYRAGVQIGLGTDGGGQQGDQFVGWTAHTEIENLVAAGLTPMQALVTATRSSAEILGLGDIGTLAPGKSADFVVLDANPLDDITNTRRINRVYLRGAEVDRARLRRSWTGGTAQ